MSEIPVIAFSAWSGTGKTTFIEHLIPELKARGLRLAVIKHDAHRFEIDREGKDSWRFTNAGADVTVISSDEKTALIEQRGLAVSELMARIHDVDLILAEGYHQEGFPTIGISRADTGKGFRIPASACIALITDESSIGADTHKIPVFSLTAYAQVADFILSYHHL